MTTIIDAVECWQDDGEWYISAVDAESGEVECISSYSDRDDAWRAARAYAAAEGLPARLMVPGTDQVAERA